MAVKAPRPPDRKKGDRFTDRCLVCNASMQGAHQQRLYCSGCGPKATAAGGAGKARAMLNAAVRRGEMPPARTLRCVDCAAPATDYDHRDYSKPLAVDAVCRRCNLRRGPALRGGERATPEEFLRRMRASTEAPSHG